MKVEIRKLTPDLLEDYLYFFENEAHADNEAEDRCYCVCWCSDDHREGKDFSTPEKRRDLAVQYINNGTIQGYLVYCDGQVMGWCNANTKSDCLNCISWRRFMTSVKTEESAITLKVKSIFCFTIASNIKRKGIATQLLERVCKDAADDGFDFIESYPNKTFINIFRDFMGPLEIYKKSGFTIHEEMENIYVMRKYLKLEDLQHELILNIDKLHTTDLGIERIKRNLCLDMDDVVTWCRNKIKEPNSNIIRKGKNWYIYAVDCEITVNAYSYTIITAHKLKNK